MLGTGQLLPLLPLGVVVVQGRGQHGVWEEPTAGEEAHTQEDALTNIL